MCLTVNNPSDPCCDGSRSKKQIGVDIYRLSKTVGPLNDDATIPGTIPWSVLSEPVDVNEGQTARFVVLITSDSKPRSTVIGVGAPRPLRDRAEFLTAPMRSTVSNVDENFYKRRLASETTQTKRPTAHGLSIPEGSHCGPLVLQSLELPIHAAIQGDAPIGLNFGGSEAAFVRVLLNGVPVTGVIPIAVPASRQINLSATFPPIVVGLEEAIEVQEGDTLEWDIWYRIPLLGILDAGLPLLGFALSVLYAYEGTGFLFPYYGDHAEWVFGALNGANANYRRLSPRLKWKLRVPPGSDYLFRGVDRELALVPQQGWDYSTGESYLQNTDMPPGEIRLKDPSSPTGDSIVFRWWQELPEIVLTTYPRDGGGVGVRVRYQIFGDQYDPWDNGQNGVWNPWSKQKFTLQGLESGYFDGIEGASYWSTIDYEREFPLDLVPDFLMMIPYQTI